MDTKAYVCANLGHLSSAKLSTEIVKLMSREQLELILGRYMADKMNEQDLGRQAAVEEFFQLEDLGEKFYADLARKVELRGSS